jgi:hypothetical protein
MNGHRAAPGVDESLEAWRRVLHLIIPILDSIASRLTAGHSLKPFVTLPSRIAQTINLNQTR